MKINDFIPSNQPLNTLLGFFFGQGGCLFSLQLKKESTVFIKVIFYIFSTLQIHLPEKDGKIKRKQLM